MGIIKVQPNKRVKETNGYLLYMIISTFYPLPLAFASSENTERITKARREK